MLVPVTSYVKKYICQEYGPGPYVIDKPHAMRSRLRISFLQTHNTGILYPSLYTHSNVSLEIARSPALVEYYENHLQSFFRGCFFADDFFESFYNQVKGLNEFKDTPYEEGIRLFRDKYKITEEDYSLDNLTRQFRRRERKKREMQGFRKEYSRNYYSVKF